MELDQAEQRAANHSLFSTYEPVRLWLKEREIRAPFRKVVVTLSDEASFARWHGNVVNVAGACEVTEAVEPTAVAQEAGNHRWVLGVAAHALGCIDRNMGWRSGELDDFINAMSARHLPHVHFFENLAKVENASGIKCVPWLSTRPGETVLGLRIAERDVTILSKAGPIYVEDAFPMAKALLRERQYVLVDTKARPWRACRWMVRHRIASKLRLVVLARPRLP
jgi:hypothetical protein